MSEPDDLQANRLSELLADLVLQGLSPEEQDELDRLAVEHETERLALEAIVAEVDNAGQADRLENLPALLRLRVERQALVCLRSSTDLSSVRKIVSRAFPWLGWVAAAALLLLSRPVVERKVEEPPITERLATARRLKLASTDHPLAKGAGGTLAWSGEQQEGFLSIDGLAEVEPGRGIYQLWIFDSTRDDRYPVDGGTFAITDARQPTLIPIHPSIPIRKPTLFAITLEPPGGVVVSDRKRILLTASP